MQHGGIACGMFMRMNDRMKWEGNLDSLAKEWTGTVCGGIR